MGKLITKLMTVDRRSNIKYWWLYLGAAVLLAMGLPLVPPANVLGDVIFGIAIVIVAFQGGFHYNNWMREKNRSRGFLPSLDRRSPSGIK